MSLPVTNYNQAEIIESVARMKALTRCENTKKAYDKRRQRFLVSYYTICADGSIFTTYVYLLLGFLYE